MAKIYYPIAILILGPITGYVVFQDFYICSLMFTTLIFFLSWIFNFPNGDWLRIQHLNHYLYRLGKITSNEVKVKKNSNNKTVAEFVHDYVDLKNYTIIEIRLHDTHELIEDTQEGIIKSLIPYAFLLIAAIFAYFNIGEEIKKNPSSYVDLKKYKDLAGMVYIAIGFVYISWLTAPVLIQKKKNIMSSHH